MELLGLGNFKIVIVIILVIVTLFLALLVGLVFMGTLGGTAVSTGLIYGKMKDYAADMPGYYQHKRYDLKHVFFNWIMALFGVSKVQDEAVPHESPFVCPMGEVKEFVPMADEKKFFGLVYSLKPPDPSYVMKKPDKDMEFFYYPTFGVQNRDDIDGSRDNGKYFTTGTIFHVMHLTAAHYTAKWEGRDVDVAVLHNRVQLRTTLRGKCVSKIEKIPAPLNSLAKTAIEKFPNLNPPYAYNKQVAAKFPPAPYGDPIVGTEGWIRENLGKSNFYSDLSKLAAKKEQAKEYEWYSMRVAFVAGKVGASKEDNPYLDNGGWGVDGGHRREVQERFTETFRFYPYDMKHITVGKAYKFGTILGWIKDSGISKLVITFEPTKKEAEKHDMSGAKKAAKDFYEALKKLSESCFKNPYVPHYVDSRCCELSGNVVIVYYKCAAENALYLLGFSFDNIDKMLENTNFIDDYYPYPVFFEIYTTMRGVNLTKNSPEQDKAPEENYVEFYKKEVMRRSEDTKTELEDTYVNPPDFMVPFTTIQNPNQNLHGFTDEGQP